MGVEAYNKAADKTEDDIARLKRVFNKKGKYTYGDLFHVHKFIKWAYTMFTLGKGSDEFKREFRESLHNDMERKFRKLSERHQKLVEALGHDKRSAELTLAHLQAVLKSDEKMAESQEVVAKRIAQEESDMQSGAPKEKLDRIEKIVGVRPETFKDRTESAAAEDQGSVAAPPAEASENNLPEYAETDPSPPPEYRDRV